MKCSGDSSQTCGNGNRLQIYHTTASIVPSGWTETGCIIDSSSARALGAYQTTSSTNTPSNCIHTCTSKSYYYAGVEYGDEVWIYPVCALLSHLIYPFPLSVLVRQHNHQVRQRRRYRSFIRLQSELRW
jgi:hypothetical protein